MMMMNELFLYVSYTYISAFEGLGFNSLTILDTHTTTLTKSSGHCKVSYIPSFFLKKFEYKITRNKLVHRNADLEFISVIKLHVHCNGAPVKLYVQVSFLFFFFFFLFS